MNIKLYPPLAIHELGKRENQEDFIYPALGKSTAEDCLFIVCDGMGGHEHGEVASSTFAKAIARFFEGRISPDIVLADQTLLDAIEFAYTRLDAIDDGNFKKMGTTLTLLYFHCGGLTAAHIGDSRIYHIRPSKGLLYVSRDHSLVFDLFQSGEITYDEMRSHSSKNVITRAVQPGRDNRAQPDIIHITDIQPDDWFFMCSDGMLEQMEDDDLVQLLSSSGSDNMKRQRLIAATVDNRDNHSAYLVHVESVTRDESDANLAINNEEMTSRCNSLNIMPINRKLSQENDVKMVPPSYLPECKVPKNLINKSSKRKWLLLLLIVALIVGTWFLFNYRQHEESSVVQNVNDTILQEKKASEIRPIAPIRHSYDSSKKQETPKVQPNNSKVRHVPAMPSHSVDSPKMKLDLKGLKKIVPSTPQAPSDNNSQTNDKTDKEPQNHNG